MDPQHRLLLEVCWEALEHAGESPAGLRGTHTGVFIGISNSDYLRLLLADTQRIDAYSTSGNALSVAAGRISYLLGVHGPSIAVDTACSSSLVAVHLACQSLRSGESTMALAGGVNLILAPELNINFSKARMLAPDGRCKTFDAAANGYIRSEGCAVVLLKPLAAALAARNPILGLIRGSAVNQDGRSAGITAPNGPAQEAVIRAALRSAGVPPRNVTYVEAHGTGTPLGDPIEVQALAAALGEGRPADSPLAIGSVKTNLGHLEAAAGIAGLLKAVLALKHRAIPPHLHLREKNPHIDWQKLPLTIPTEMTAWPAGANLIAGVSSFGMSGTNAHLVLEAAPAVREGHNQRERPLHILALSGKSPAAVRELAERYERRLAEQGGDLADLCFTANAGRSTFSHRLAVAGADGTQIREGLAAFAAAPQAVPADACPKIAFVYAGQGPQYAGMARELYGTSPVFRAAIERCDELLRAHLSRSLLQALFPSDGGERLLEDTTYAQPAMFAIEYALTELWRSWGMEPAMVAGHSLGEYAAAFAAGCFSLEDALKLVAARARLTGSLPSTGAMVSVFAPEERVQAALGPFAQSISVAVVNGKNHLVVSGALSELGKLTSRLESEGIKFHRLNIANSFHSPLLDPVLDEFEAIGRTVRYAPPQTALVSTLTGEMADGNTPFTGSYWRRQARQPVRFSAALDCMYNQGIRHFVEVGPKPVLAGIGLEAYPETKWFASLTPGRPDWEQLLETLRALYLEGVAVNWAGFDGDYARARVHAPTYPFQRQRYWGAAAKPPAASGVSMAEAIRAAGNRESGRAPIDVDVRSYAGKWQALENLTVAHVYAALSSFGLFAEADAPFSAASAMNAGGIPAAYRQLVNRWLELLAARGYLRRTGGAYLFNGIAGPELESCRRAAEAALHDDPALLEYVRNCSARFQAVITGQDRALETLFPGGSPELAENLYTKAGMSRYTGAVTVAVVDAIARSFPAPVPLRIIEIGAGTGGATAALLPVLPAERAEYLFTDVSEFFFARAMERFAAYRFLRFGRLDIDTDLEAQGYAPGSFDVVIAANAMHAAKDLGAALERARRLLAPGGAMVLLETTRHQSWFDMTTGLIEGWQHFQDDLRTDSPLLTAERWQALLAAQGFETVECFPGPDTPGEIFSQTVIAACLPGQSAGARPDNGRVSPGIAGPAEPVAGERASILSTLALLPCEERERQMLEFVSERVCRVLHRNPSQPPGKRERLMELGMDSLMAVQFRNLLQKDLGLKEAIPATLIFDYPTVEGMAEMLLGKVSGMAPVKPEAAPAWRPVTEDQLAGLSEEEVEVLLNERLTGLGTGAAPAGAFRNRAADVQG